nr:uncharacterized protein LOC129268704 [Lytechinus pictus]
MAAPEAMILRHFMVEVKVNMMDQSNKADKMRTSIPRMTLNLLENQMMEKESLVLKRGPTLMWPKDLLMINKMGILKRKKLINNSTRMRDLIWESIIQILRSSLKICKYQTGMKSSLAMGVM